MLVQQYLSYTGLGMQYAITAELATKDSITSDERSDIIGSSLVITGLISFVLLLLGLGIQVTGFPLFEKYYFSHYALALFLVVGLYHLQQLFTNIYRVFGYLSRIVASELLTAIIPLVSVLMFNNSPILINILLWALVFSGFLSVLIYIIKKPFKVKVGMNQKIFIRLLRMGIPLLVYNISHHLITTSGKTMVSSFYSVEEMGYYSFSHSITTGVMLGLNAVSWVVFPNILSKTHSGIPNEQVADFIQRVNKLYNTSVFFMIYLVILLLPALFIVLPQYKQASISLSVLLLAQAVLSASFGFNCVAIARKEQMKVAGVSAISAGITTGLSSLLAFTHVSFDRIALAVLFGAFVYSILQSKLGARLITRPGPGIKAFLSIIPIGSLTSVVILLIGLFTGYPTLAGLLGFFTLLLTNRQNIYAILEFINEKSSSKSNH